MTTGISCALSWVRASVGALRWRVNCHRAARIAGQSLAGGEKAQRRRGGAGEMLGGAGGWARVKSGFILPILTPCSTSIQGVRDMLLAVRDLKTYFHPRAVAPRAAPAVQAARPQPPILSVRCGASRRPAGGIQRWPAAGAGRAGRPQARASAGRVAWGGRTQSVEKAV